MPEKTTLEKLIKALNYMSAMLMVLAANCRLYEYDAKNVFMDGFYLAFTLYLIVFGVMLAAAEY